MSPRPLLFSRSLLPCIRLAVVLLIACGVAGAACLSPRAALQGAGAAPSLVGPAEGPALRVGLLPGSFPAQLLRVIDGDTIEARVAIWLGQDVVTRVRLTGVDAPEVRTRCASEKARGMESKEALIHLLGTGPLELTAVRFDKYGGRVLAKVTTADGRDVGEQLLLSGRAVPYSGGKRGQTCL